MSPPSQKQGALPVYVQLAEMLAREIGAGLLLDGERLPPERAMAGEYDVAVGTLRKALTILEERGLLERRQGSGNYIRHKEYAENIYTFFRLELQGGGGLPTAQTLGVERMAKPPGLPDFGPSDQAFRFRRLRFLDDRPAALEEIWLDGSATKRISLAEVSESLYHYYKSKLGRWISRAEDQVSIAPAPQWRVDQFGVPAGDYCGYVERIAWDQNAEPIEFSRNWFDPNVARYMSRLK